MRFVGIDLAGRSKNPTGWALLKGRFVEVMELYSDHEILSETVAANPSLVAIDAPLTMPKQGIQREADREMRRRGYPVLPPLFSGMRKLTLRANDLVKELRKNQLKIIEVHPTSTRRALRMPLKNWTRIQEIFLEMNLRGEWMNRALTPHEIDAITSAITALLYACGRAEMLGDSHEGYIIVPFPSDWREVAQILNEV